MKKLKKIISVMVVMVMVAVLSACGGSSPTSEVEKYLGDLVKGKKDEINNMVTDSINKSIFGTTEKPSEEIQGGMTEDTQELINDIVKKMEYSVNKEEIEGEKARVNVTVKGGNISKVFMGYLGDLLTLAYTSDVLSTTPQEEYFLLANSIFYEKLQGIEYEERTLDINLVKNENKWEIEDDAALYELLLGNSSDKEINSGQ